LGNFLNFSGSRGTTLPGTIIILLQQAVIPVTMVLSIIFLKIRYTWLNLLGAIILICGIVVTVIPDLIHSKLDNVNRSTFVEYVVLVLAATVPNAIAIVYLEYILKFEDIEIMSAWMWINVFELIFGLPLIFAIIPLQRISFSFTNIGKNAEYGFACLLLGVNSQSGDACPNVGYYFISYAVVIVLTRLNLTYIVNSESASLLWLSLAVAIPLASIAFTLKEIMGDTATSFNTYIIIGLIVVVVGLAIYKSSSEIRKVKRPIASYSPIF